MECLLHGSGFTNLALAGTTFLLYGPAPGDPTQPFDVVGPVCETGDTFARGREMPLLAEGDLVAFRSAGAYGAVMASEYNSRPLIAEVLVDGDSDRLIRRRQTVEELLALEAL